MKVYVQLALGRFNKIEIAEAISFVYREKNFGTFFLSHISLFPNVEKKGTLWTTGQRFGSYFGSHYILGYFG